LHVTVSLADGTSDPRDLSQSSQSVHCTIEMDQTFATYLLEIERSYLVLPKAARIRVEKWVQKLVAIGNNAVWKKQRNDYAKLLLNMIVIRNLEAPFNQMPPEGALPSFPNHLKVYHRNLLGPHESRFWRDLFEQFEGASNESKTEDIADISQNISNSNVYTSRVNDYSANQSGKKDVDVVAEAIKQVQGAKALASPQASTAASVLPLSREIQSLNLLIKEQSHRIKLLEQQLTDERAKNELQIQRLHFSNRIEVNRLKSEIDKYAMEFSVRELSPTQRRYDDDANFDRNGSSINLSTSQHQSQHQSLGRSRSYTRPRNVSRVLETSLDALGVLDLGGDANEDARQPSLVQQYQQPPPPPPPLQAQRGAASSSSPNFPIRMGSVYPAAGGGGGGRGLNSATDSRSGTSFRKASFAPAGAPPAPPSPSPNPLQSSAANSRSKRGLLSFLEQKNRITTDLNALQQQQGQGAMVVGDLADPNFGSATAFDISPQRLSRRGSSASSNDMGSAGGGAGGRGGSHSSAKDRGVAPVVARYSFGGGDDDDDDEAEDVDYDYGPVSTVAVDGVSDVLGDEYAADGGGSGGGGGGGGGGGYDYGDWPGAGAGAGVDPYAQWNTAAFRRPLQGASGGAVSELDDPHGHSSSSSSSAPRTPLNARQQQEDQDFLAYIDQFQSEIKKINTNISITSPERF
jgi:hypothetical protein